MLAPWPSSDRTPRQRRPGAPSRRRRDRPPIPGPATERSVARRRAFVGRAAERTRMLIAGGATLALGAACLYTFLVDPNTPATRTRSARSRPHRHRLPRLRRPARHQRPAPRRHPRRRRPQHPGADPAAADGLSCSPAGCWRSSTSTCPASRGRGAFVLDHARRCWSRSPWRATSRSPGLSWFSSGLN